MMLAWGLVVLLLAEGLAAALSAGVIARARLVSDQRAAVEADLALGTALAHARVQYDSLFGRVPPGLVEPLSAPRVSGWLIEAAAVRDANFPLVELIVVVRREGGSSRLAVTRRGTLLLRIGPADTALVMDNRPNY